MGLVVKEKIYFDTLQRTDKANCLLAIAYSYYFSKTKEEVAKELETFFDIFKERGSGTYNGTMGKFTSQYTSGLEFGVIKKTESLEITDLAKRMVEGDISAKQFLSNVMLNYFQVINGTPRHFLLEILNYIKEKEIVIVKKNIIEELFEDCVNIIFNIFKDTLFFESIDSSTLKLKEEYEVDFLIENCNKEMFEPNFNIHELKGSQEKYANFLTKKTFVVKGTQKKIKTKKPRILDEPYNYLVFGSPGTGKSYLLEEKRKDHFHDDNFERVTFYDGYTYGQFVGSYKPKVKIDKEKKDKEKKEEIITYEYIPGPFMKMLVKALKNLDENYLILIEELNRAKADSVFGDIFQLLDRYKDGKSKYRIAISEDQEAYLKEQGLGDIKKLYIPNNLYIWATMNSADQGVYPLDTAFKRRWSYKYLTLNENKEYFGSINGGKENKYKNYKINMGNGKKAKWDNFRTQINEIVSEGNASEDRMLAPFFLVSEDFKEIDGEEGKETFILNDEVYKFKLLSYIFDDLLTYDKKSKSKIFNSEIKSFSKLIETFDEDINGVYNDDFIKTIVDTEQPEKTEEAE